MKKKPFIFTILALTLITGLATLIFKIEGAHPPSDKLQVTASFYPMAEFARQVGGDKVAVKTLVSPGVEPHDYDPKPKDMTALYDSSVFVYNGGGIEPWATRIRGDEAKNTLTVVNASDKISLLAASEEDHHEDEEPHADEERAKDPHIWTDPVLAQTQVQNIKDGLIKADPANREYYENRATEYITKLSALDADFAQGLQSCARRDIITSHQAFHYLGERYNLEIEPISGLSPEEEPSPQKLAEVADFAKAHDVKYVFFETLVSPKLAETLAREAGAKTLVFNPLEGLTEDEVTQGKDYLSIQKENLQNLRVALDCK